MFIKRQQGLRKQLFNLAAPIFIETLLVILLGTTDIIMLSRHSDETVAAVGVVNQLLNMIFIVFGVTTLGTSVLCSQYLGAKQQTNVLQTIGVSISPFLLAILPYALTLIAMLGAAGKNSEPEALAKPYVKGSR